MRLVFGLVLVVGIGLASFAVYMAKDRFSAYQAKLAEANAAREAMVATLEVVVVNRALRYGEQIQQEDIRLVRWPEDAIPEGTFASVEGVFPPGETRPRRATRRSRGRPVICSRAAWTCACSPAPPARPARSTQSSARSSAAPEAPRKSRWFMPMAILGQLPATRCRLLTSQNQKAASFQSVMKTLPD